MNAVLIALGAMLVVAGVAGGATAIASTRARRIVGAATRPDRTTSLWDGPTEPVDGDTSMPVELAPKPPLLDRAFPEPDQ